MKKKIAILCIAILVITIYSCRKNADKLTGTAYLDLPATPYIYNTTTNGDGSINHKATLGRVLFYDTHLSLNNAISCGSCHKQALGFADNTPLSVGYQGMLTKRNSKGIANITGDTLNFYRVGNHNLPLFWDGRVDVLDSLTSRPVTNHVEMGIADFNELPAKLSGLSYYSQLFVNAYGDSSITPGRLSECVSVFLASIRTGNSKFDQFVADLLRNNFQFSYNNPYLTVLETRGFSLFTSTYNCDNCHHMISSTYTSDDFKDIGLDKNYLDLGKGAVSKMAYDNGTFRVPSLHNVALSAPYMHDGRYKTLSDVLDHYSHFIQESPNLDFNLRDSTGHARQMNISDGDKESLIAFLNSMTDYQMVTDPKFSNPFKVK